MVVAGWTEAAEGWSCPECHKTNSKEARVCGNCKRGWTSRQLALKEQKEVELQTRRSAEQDQPQGRKKKCPRCKAMNSLEAGRCKDCGESLPRS